jgi:uncharacterized OB-fold protein
MSSTITTPNKPVPMPTRETRPFWDGCKAGELRIQRCAACGHKQFFPRMYCVRCFGDRIEWMKASGLATVSSFTIVRRPVSAAFAADIPYVVALVTLEEGPVMMTNIVGCDPERVRIGMAVEATFEDWTEEISVPKFRPVG